MEKLLLKYGLAIYLTIDVRKSDSEPMLSDSHRIREYRFCCVFLFFAKFIGYLVGDTSLRLIYIH